jgi:heptosyltransferase-3
MPSFKRILIIKMKFMGDVLLASPVLHALKEAWPQAQVSFLVAKGTEEMISNHPLLDELLVVNRRQETAFQALALAAQIRRRRFDLVLELTDGDRGAIYSWLSRARVRLGFDYPGRPFWQRYLAFTHLVPGPVSPRHMVEQNLMPLALLGLNTPDPWPAFYWPDQAETRIRSLLATLKLTPGNFVVMHPGASARTKCWSPEGYARVVELLQEEFRLPVVLTGAPNQIDRNLAAAILEQAHSPPHNLVERLSLKELGALFSRARFFFGVDSAPMHMAAAVNIPVVALFGHTNVVRWGPWGYGHLVIKKEWDCQPCQGGRCINGADITKGHDISPCLASLSPEEVIARMRKNFPALQGGKKPAPPPGLGWEGPD